MLPRGAAGARTRALEVIENPNRRWYDNKLDPTEAARRKKAAEKFNAQYKN